MIFLLDGCCWNLLSLDLPFPLCIFCILFCCLKHFCFFMFCPVWNQFQQLRLAVWQCEPRSTCNFRRYHPNHAVWSTSASQGCTGSGSVAMLSCAFITFISFLGPSPQENIKPGFSEPSFLTRFASFVHSFPSLLMNKSRGSSWGTLVTAGEDGALRAWRFKERQGNRFWRFAGRMLDGFQQKHLGLTQSTWWIYAIK